MALKLDTGVIQTPRSTVGQQELDNLSADLIVQFNDTTPHENVVYPAQERPLLRVNTGEMVLITAYNMDVNTKILFSKVLVSSGVPVHGNTECCNTLTVGHSIRLYSTQLPSWTMDYLNPVFAIETPGDYEFDIVDGVDVVVTAMAYPQQKINPLVIEKYTEKA